MGVSASKDSEEGPQQVQHVPSLPVHCEGTCLHTRCSHSLVLRQERGEYIEQLVAHTGGHGASTSLACRCVSCAPIYCRTKSRESVCAIDGGRLHKLSTCSLVATWTAFALQMFADALMHPCTPALARGS